MQRLSRSSYRSNNARCKCERNSDGVGESTSASSGLNGDTRGHRTPTPLYTPLRLHVSFIQGDFPKLQTEPLSLARRREFGWRESRAWSMRNRLGR